MSKASSSTRLLLITVGFALWASAFVAMYSLNAVGCAFGWRSSFQRAALVFVFAAHLLTLGWIAMRQWHGSRAAHDAATSASFIDFVGLGTLIAAWVATLLNLAPVFFLELCAR